MSILYIVKLNNYEIMIMIHGHSFNHDLYTIPLKLPLPLYDGKYLFLRDDKPMTYTDDVIILMPYLEEFL